MHFRVMTKSSGNKWISFKVKVLSICDVNTELNIALIEGYQQYSKPKHFEMLFNSCACILPNFCFGKLKKKRQFIVILRKLCPKNSSYQNNPAELF